MGKSPYSKMWCLFIKVKTTILLATFWIWTFGKQKIISNSKSIPNLLFRVQYLTFSCTHFYETSVAASFSKYPHKNKWSVRFLLNCTYHHFICVPTLWICYGNSTRQRWEVVTKLPSNLIRTLINKRLNEAGNFTWKSQQNWKWRDWILPTQSV